MIKLLVQRGAKINKSSPQVALMQTHESNVGTLLSLGADPNLRIGTDGIDSPLQWSLFCRFGAKTIKLLLRSRRSNPTIGDNVIRLAVEHGDMEVRPC